MNFRFRPVAVKAVIHNVLNEELSGKQYSMEEANSWCKNISDSIKDKLKGEKYWFFPFKKFEVMKNTLK